MADTSACAKVRSTCASFSSEAARIDHSALDRFADSIDLQALKTFCFSGDGLSTNRFSEISFSTPSEEAGFIFLAHALDFGSGFRPQLHKYRNGHGAWLTIRAGLVSLGTENNSISARWLCSLSVENIKRHFDLGHAELEALALNIHEDVQEIGNNLIAAGFETPGEYVMARVEGGAAALVEDMVHMFPLCFNDEYVVRSQTICFYKKAQLVVSELYMRFASEISVFNYHDVDHLTAFVDNVVVAVMRLYGVVKAAPELELSIANGIPVVKGSEEEVALRSASLTAIEIVVSRLNTKFGGAVDNPGEGGAGRLQQAWSVTSPKVNAQMVCNWMWGCEGKAGVNRQFPRHLTPSTSYY